MKRILVISTAAFALAISGVAGADPGTGIGPCQSLVAKNPGVSVPGTRSGVPIAPCC
jgi:hypothetical protein